MKDGSGEGLGKRRAKQVLVGNIFKCGLLQVTFSGIRVSQVPMTVGSVQGLLKEQQ